MARQELVVLDGSAVVGRLERASGALAFRYDGVWRSDPAATPLSTAMPLDVAEHPDPVVSPWLWGLLPDNERVLARWGRTFSTTTSSPTGGPCWPSAWREWAEIHPLRWLAGAPAAEGEAAPPTSLEGT